MPTAIARWSSASVGSRRSALRGRTELTEAVARYYFKLLAYKDEYEVARLYTSGEFLDQLRRQFEGQPEAQDPPGAAAGRAARPATGAPQEARVRPWMLTAMRHLARCKRLRGTPFDPFGHSAERRPGAPPDRRVRSHDRRGAAAARRRQSRDRARARAPARADPRLRSRQGASPRRARRRGKASCSRRCARRSAGSAPPNERPEPRSVRRGSSSGRASTTSGRPRSRSRSSARSDAPSRRPW